MTTTPLTARERAVQYIQDALATGVRGETRTHLLKAAEAAQGNATADITQLAYDRLPVGETIRDKARPGLIMRNGKRTGRVWIYRHKTAGHVAEVQFGSYPQMQVAEARQLWAEMRDKKRQNLPIVQAPVPTAEMTMGELVNRYIEEYARPLKRSWEMDAAYLREHIAAHYGDTPVSEFTADTLRHILAPVWARTPRTAEKIRSVIHGMFAVATKGSRKLGNLSGRTWLPPNTPNPAAAILLPERHTSTYSPTTGDMRALLRAVGDHGQVGAAIELQALTCARVSEVTGIHTRELDLDAGTWLLPAERSKNGKAHLVMLPRQAIALIREIGIDDGYLFPGIRGASHITRNTVGRTFAAIRAEHGLADGFTSHRLRNACLTWLAESQASREIRDRVSNHTDSTGGADAIYNTAQLNTPAREWLQRWADHLTALASDNVVEIRNAK